MTPAELVAYAKIMEAYGISRLQMQGVSIERSAPHAPPPETPGLPVPPVDPLAQNEERWLYASSVPMTKEELQDEGPPK